MPANETPQLKDPELYDRLRADGASKEKAARISNAGGGTKEGRSVVARRGGEAGSYEDWTVAELRERARELGLTGYSRKKKDQLIEALREH